MSLWGSGCPMCGCRLYVDGPCAGEDEVWLERAVSEIVGNPNARASVTLMLEALRRHRTERWEEFKAEVLR